MQGLGDSDLYRVRRKDTMESSSEEGTVERKPRTCQMKALKAVESDKGL